MPLNAVKKRFNGELFSRFPIPETSLKSAQTSAKRQRERGMKVRVVKEGKWYFLYGRPK